MKNILVTIGIAIIVIITFLIITNINKYETYETANYEFQSIKGLKPIKGMSNVIMYVNDKNEIVITITFGKLENENIEEQADIMVNSQKEQNRFNITKTEININGLKAYKVTFNSDVKKFICTYIQKDSTLFFIDSDSKNKNEEAYNLVEKTFKVK